MDNDEATKKIRKLAQKPENIVFASQEGVESFPDAFVDEFLKDICDVDGAWISDESSIYDFGFSTSEESRKKFGYEKPEVAWEKIREKYGVDVTGKDILLDIFRVVYAVNRTTQ